MNYVVIGATSAVAISCIEIWAAGGANFYLVGRSHLKLLELSKRLSLSYPQSKFTYIEASLSDAEEISTVVSINATCDGDIHFLVAQGFFPDHESTIRDVTISKQVFDVNALNIIFFLQNLLLAIESNKSTTITVIGSISGDVVRKSDFVYAASKSMINHFVGGLAESFASSNLNIYLIKLGPTRTNMLRGNRFRLFPVQTPKSAAKKIVALHRKHSGTYYIPFFWKYIIFIYNTIKAATGFLSR